MKTILCGTGLTLWCPLGPWTTPATSKDYFISQSRALFQQSGHGWMEYQCNRSNQQGRQYPLDSGRFITALPDNDPVMRTVGWERGSIIYTTGVRDALPRPPAPQAPQDWKSLIQSVPHASWICTWMALPPCHVKCAKQLYRS